MDGGFFSFLHGWFGLGFGAYRERSLVFYYFSTFFHVTFLGTFLSLTSLLILGRVKSGGTRHTLHRHHIII